MEDLQSLKENTEKLKSTQSTNVVRHETFFYSLEMIVKNVKSLDEGMICCVELGIHPSAAASVEKKKW
jgi:hypothetical protein